MEESESNRKVNKTKEDEEYDRLTAQLAQEAKGKASDRQKTQEERWSGEVE